MMFNAYRSFKSSKTLNLAKSKIENYRSRIQKHLNAIPAIENALNLVVEEKKPSLIQKMEDCRLEAIRLAKACDEYETNCQVTGVLPEFKG